LHQYIGTVLQHSAEEYSNILDWREWVKGENLEAAIAATQSQVVPFLRKVTDMMNSKTARVVNPIAPPRSEWEQTLSDREDAKREGLLKRLKEKEYAFFD